VFLISIHYFAFSLIGGENKKLHAYKNKMILSAAALERECSFNISAFGFTTSSKSVFRVFPLKGGI